MCSQTRVCMSSCRRHAYTHKASITAQTHQVWHIITHSSPTRSHCHGHGHYIGHSHGCNVTVIMLETVTVMVTFWHTNKIMNYCHSHNNWGSVSGFSTVSVVNWCSKTLLQSYYPGCLPVETKDQIRMAALYDSLYLIYWYYFSILSYYRGWLPVESELRSGWPRSILFISIFQL
jgi:hypothetical protein